MIPSWAEEGEKCVLLRTLWFIGHSFLGFRNLFALLWISRCVAASLRLFLLMFEVEEKLCFSSTNWRILLDSLLHLPYLRYVCS